MLPSAPAGNTHWHILCWCNDIREQPQLMGRPRRPPSLFVLDRFPKGTESSNESRRPSPHWIQRGLGNTLLQRLSHGLHHPCGHDQFCHSTSWSFFERGFKLCLLLEGCCDVRNRSYVWGGIRPIPACGNLDVATCIST